MGFFNLRPELLHPIFVHFPVALTVFALLVYMFSLFLREDWWIKTARVLLYAALGFLLVALFTGDFATDAIRRELCDIHALQAHEEYAYYTLYFLMGALAADLGIALLGEYIGVKWILPWLKLLLLIGANICLVISGHYGGSLVYEQGAAVKGVKIECSR